jgi:hypothetical protein
LKLCIRGSVSTQGAYNTPAFTNTVVEDVWWCFAKGGGGRGSGFLALKFNRRTALWLSTKLLLADVALFLSCCYLSIVQMFYATVKKELY